MIRDPPHPSPNGAAYQSEGRSPGDGKALVTAKARKRANLQPRRGENIKAQGETLGRTAATESAPNGVASALYHRRDGLAIHRNTVHELHALWMAERVPLFEPTLLILARISINLIQMTHLY